MPCKSSGLRRLKVQLPLTCDEAELRLRVDAGQVGLLLSAVILSVLPRLGHLRLELVAEVSVQQVTLVAVGVCGTATPSVSYHYTLRAKVPCARRRSGRPGGAVGLVGFWPPVISQM